MIDVTALRYFVSVGTNRNVSRAAEELHVSQSAVSRQIKILESALGVLLLERTNRGIVLTDGGQVALDRARELLRLLEQLKSDVSVLPRRSAGRLRVGFPSSLARSLILPAVTELTLAHPDLHWTLFEGFSDEISTMVAQDQLEVGIISRPALSNRLRTTPLFKEEIWLFNTPDQWEFEGQSISAAALAGLPLITTKLVGWQIAGWLAEHGHKTGHITETNAGGIYLGLTRAGIGYITAPLAACFDELESGTLVGAPIEGLFMTRYVVEREGTARAPSAEWLLDALRKPGAQTHSPGIDRKG